VNVFVAGFIGSPAMNMLDATVERHDGGLRVTAGEAHIELDGELASARPGLAAYEHRPLVLGIRPEHLEDAAFADERLPRLRGRSVLREAIGSETLIHFSVAARQAVTDDVRELAQDVGDDRTLDELASGPPPTATLVGRFDPRTRIREGDAIEVSVEHEALHFFDPASGLAIT